MNELTQDSAKDQAVAPLLPMEQESPAKQAKIDALVAHNPAEEVVDLGKIEDLENIQATAEVRPATDSETVAVSKNRLLLIKKIAQNLRDSAAQLSELLTAASDNDLELKTPIKVAGLKPPPLPLETGADVIEGLFDGEKMIGPDGKTYDVPANYASKSHLVEGDLLKLIITANGSFIFKQIKAVERRRLVGNLEENELGEYFVLADDRRWRVLTASVSYYKGEVGDEVIVVVPQAGQSRWGAVENIIKR